VTNVIETCKIWPGNNRAECGKPVGGFGMCEEHRDNAIKEYRTKIHHHYTEIDGLIMKLRALDAST
jgi:hypothetical protein